MLGVLGLALVSTLGVHKVKVAVLDVQDVSSGQAEHARLITQIITGEVGRDGTIEVISSSQIRDMIGFEREKKLLGCTESSCLAEIGGALGVDYLLTGQLGKIGSRYRLDLTLINQSKSRIAASRGDFLPDEEDALANASVMMVNDLLVKAGLRNAASAVLVTQTTKAEVSHTGAYVGFGVSAALLAGAGVMTALTHSTYESAVSDYQNASKFPTRGSSPNGSKLGWMAPLTDALWVGAVGAAGVGTYLYFSATPASSGAGGDIAVGGRF